MFIFLNLILSFLLPYTIYGQTSSNGIQSLRDLNGQSIHKFLSHTIQPLILQEEIEQFLQDLEGSPPNWRNLYHSDITTQSERLFQFNRARDAFRNTHPLLDQPIAFLWSALLRTYSHEHNGFSLALGPLFTETSWGVIRFKPLQVPDYLVAVPSPQQRQRLLDQQRLHQPTEILVVFIGTLVSDESLIYAFSHDDEQQGMILPVVAIQEIQYFFDPG